MIYLGAHAVGTVVKYRANFHSDAGTLEDPTSPEAQCEYPDASFNALTAPAKINSKTGHFGGSIDTAGFDTGQYIIRVKGTVSTAKQVATEFCFQITGYDPEATPDDIDDFPLKRNTGSQHVPFYMRDTANPQVGKAGTPTITRSLNGAAFGAITGGTITDLGSGAVDYSPSAADCNAVLCRYKAVLSGAITEIVDIYTHV